MNGVTPRITSAIGRPERPVMVHRTMAPDPDHLDLVDPLGTGRPPLTYIGFPIKLVGWSRAPIRAVAVIDG
jgi:hypothetical protein